MKKLKNFNKLIIVMAVLLMAIIILLISKSVSTSAVNTDSYDYENDKAERFTDFKSDEDNSFSKVKSSIDYKIKPLTFKFKSGELTADVSGQSNSYPFIIKSLTHKNNGLFLCMEFKDSGFIKDFQLTIKVNENTKVIKQPLIDCSNKIMLYVPFSFSQEITESGVDVTISNIYWQEASITNLATINYEKSLANTNCSKTVIKKNDDKSDAYTVKYNNLLDFSLEKTSYNSLHLATINRPQDLATYLKNLIFDKVSTKYYVIFVNSHNQTNSNKFYAHLKEDVILKSDAKIEQIKICIEKE